MTVSISLNQKDQSIPLTNKVLPKSMYYISIAVINTEYYNNTLSNRTNILVQTY